MLLLASRCGSNNESIEYFVDASHLFGKPADIGPLIERIDNAGEADAFPNASNNEVRDAQSWVGGQNPLDLTLKSMW